MSGRQPTKQTKWLDAVAPLTGTITLAAGLIILLGWRLDIAVMRSLLPGFAPVNATVSVCMVLAGISQLAFCIRFASRWFLRFSQLCAMNLIVLGLITEVALAFGWQQLLDDPWKTAIGVGFAFFVTGLALLSGNWRLKSGLLPSIWLGWMVVVLGLLSLSLQFMTGGVHIRGQIGQGPQFVIATSLILIVIGMGLALPSAARPFYLPQHTGNTSPPERRIYAVLCLTLTAMLAVLFALLFSNMEYANRNQELIEALETERAIRQVIENSERLRIESRGYAGAQGGPEKIKQILQYQSRLELAVDRLRSRAALEKLSAAPEKRRLAEVEQGTRMLRENLRRRAAGVASAEMDGPGNIEVLATGIRESARDLDAHLLTLRSYRLDRDRQGFIWLYFISIGSILLMLPLGYLCLRTLRIGFEAIGRAGDEIEQINAALEAKIAERTAQLAESERGHRNLLDNFPGVAYRGLGDEDFTCNYVSAGSQELLGIAPGEFTAGRQKFSDLVHPDDLPQFIEGAKASFRGQDVNQEYRMIRPDGGVRWLTAYIHPSLMVDGVAQEFEGYVVDISDRKRAEMRREVHLAVLASLSSRAALPTTLDIVTTAVEQQCPGVLCSILLVDESGRFLRYGSAPSLPESYRLATDGMEIGPESGCCGTAVFRRERVIAEDIEKDPLWSEYSDVAAAAGLRSCWSEPMPGGVDGEIRGTFATYRREPGQPTAEEIEIIEWASYFGNMAIGMEQSLKNQVALEAAEKANMVKSRFLATMSHEIRTPLNAVLGMVDLMLNSAQDPLQTRQMMSAIVKSSNVLRRVVDDILEFSLGASSTQELDNEAVDLSALVQSVVDSQSESARENDVQISLACDPGIPSWLFADEARLRRVLSNLLDNAIKFSGRQAGRVGHVELSVESRECEVGMARLYLNISDDGIGMTEQEIQLANQPFSQADTSSTRAFDGTGLGLALTTHLLQLMESKLEFRSDFGHGLQVGFELLLPICTNHQAPGSAQSSLETPRKLSSIADAEASGRLILLAEDNQMNQRVIVLQLRTLGYAVEIAGNGREALAMWKSGRYSLLLVDFHMPQMDGFELTREIRKLEAATGERKPIIGITASTVPSEFELSATVGMDGYVHKPATLETLLEKLEPWLPLDEGGIAPAWKSAVLDAQDEKSVVDWHALGGYMGTDDKVLLTEFFTEFLHYGTGTLAEIAQATGAQDAAQVGALAHRFKSSALMVGANRLADSCLRLERAGLESRWRDIHHEHALLQDSFAAVVAEAGEHDIVM